MACSARTVTLFAAVLFLGGLTFASAPVEVEVVSDVGSRIVLRCVVNDWKREPVAIDGEAYAWVRIPGEPVSFERGAPALPYVSRSVVIPDDAAMAVMVLSSRYEDVPLRVAPSKGLLPRNVDPAQVPFTWGEAYQVDAFLPAEIADLGRPYILRDHRGIVVRFHPFQYNAAAGTLRIHREIVAEVVAVGPGIENVLQRRDASRPRVAAFEDLYRSHFLNAPEAGGGSPLLYSPLDEQGSMLVIAHDPWIPSLDAFVAHKASRGLTVDVVGVSTIGNDAASIKSYIQNVYDTSDLAFVLLVGDAAQVATPIRPVSFEQGAADPLYSKLAGSDDYPDVMVGRFSASTAAHVDTQAQRTITYESTPAWGQGWFWRGVGIASAEGLGAGDEGQSDRQHQDEIRGWLLGAGYTSVDQIYDPGATDTMVSNALNAGRGIVNYTGHGSATSWGTTGFNNADVDALVNDNMLPFIVAVACNNGEFHHYDACFAEAWLRATNEATGAPTGAVAMYASSVSQSWAPPMEGQDEFNLKLTDPARPYGSFGALAFAGSCSMMDKYGGGGVEMFDTWNVFGDPSVIVVGSKGMEVAPAGGLVSQGPAGGPYDVTSLTYTLKNNDPDPFDFEVIPGTPWVGVSVSSGTIPPGGTVDVTVTLADSSRNLDNGNHGDTVRFVNRSTHRGDTTRPVSLRVGESLILRRYALDSDPGWSRNGEWQFGAPLGVGGGHGMNDDPAAAATGTNVLGANLAGAVSKSVSGPFHLTMGPENLAGCSDVRLSFSRWLNAPTPPEVVSTVEVSTNGTTWSSLWSAAGLVTDAAWTSVTLDLGASANDASALRVRWGYQVAQRVPAAGTSWNLDDIVLRAKTATARVTLNVEPGQLTWSQVPGAIAFDVIRGDLGVLLATGGDFSQSTETCVGNNVPGSTLTYSEVPPPDTGKWFLVRGVSLSGPMTWQTLAGPQTGLRDAEIAAAGASCP